MRWAWVERSVWTERMLEALEQGVKGGMWFSLIDKVYRPETLYKAWTLVKANRGGAGADHQTIEGFERNLEGNLERLHEEKKRVAFVIATFGTTDAFGHTQLGGAGPEIARIVKDGLGYKYHWAVADYLQRAARHIASKSDVDQAYAMGKAAVEFAIKGNNSVMPTIVRKSSKPYKWSVGMAPLSKVANVEKMMPADYITTDGFGITAKCRTYLEPLIKGEDYPPYRDGMPQYVRLKNTAVKKKLKGEFKV